MSSPSSWIQAGEVALRQAQWEKARDCFASALQIEDTPFAHDGLGQALWWLNDIAAAHEHRAAAYRGYKQQGESARAALIAVWLGREQMFFSGNDSAMNGWFARANRLLQETTPRAEHGWCDLLKASMVATPDALAQIAEQAITLAQAVNDPDLEAMGLAFYGMAEVSRGRVAPGLQAIDEAIVAAIGGELQSFMTVSEVFCVTLRQRIVWRSRPCPAVVPDGR